MESKGTALNRYSNLFHTREKRKFNRQLCSATLILFLIFYVIFFIVVYCALFGNYEIVTTTTKLIKAPVNYKIDAESTESASDAPNRTVLPWWESLSCDEYDPHYLNLDTAPQLKSYCSYRASLLGPNQNVLSFSLHGNYSDYASGFEDILQTVKEIYPGWVIRLHTDPELYKSQLCPLVQKYNHLYVCDINKLAGGRRPNLTSVEPRLWRVAPIGDELVDVILSRDIDSEMLDRETFAVEEFLQSNHTLHIMRDHPSHGAAIMSGMFGVRQTEQNLNQLRNIRNKVLGIGTIARGSKYKTFDQIILERYLLPRLQENSLTHDSYTCSSYPWSRPYPIQRKDMLFVGNRRYRPLFRDEVIKQECPSHCRPKNHQEWIYC